MIKTIRIGTRSSELAMWQAKKTTEELRKIGYSTKIIKIDSYGDLDLDKPLYKMGITGVFTKNLDIALLNDKIDIAVNSLKDVPTDLPDGIIQAAVLERGDYNDVLVYKDSSDFSSKEHAVIATGSLRRKALWLNRYPHHHIVGLRGNINTRMAKLNKHDWNGAIFAFVGLKRIDLLPKKYLKLDWMLPSPAQGAIMIAAHSRNKEIIDICSKINHPETEICTAIERDFMHELEGGCSAPIAALATIEGEIIHFKGTVLSPDGKKRIDYSKDINISKAKHFGITAAKEILKRGGREIIQLKPLPEKKIQIISTKSLLPDQTELFLPEIAVFTHDFIKIQYNNIDMLLPYSNKHVIFTSKNAVKSLLNSFSKEDLKFKNIYCVGQKTKNYIEARIGPVQHSEESSKKLALYLTNSEIKEITYFCGENRRDELPDLLIDKHIKITEIKCYKTILTPKRFTSDYNGVLFFSPSGIQSFLQENKSKELTAFCIGETTAKEAEKYFKEIVTAKTPTVESVIKTVNKTYS